MKLLVKTNRYYIFYSVITYLVIAVLFYVLMDRVIRTDVEERLEVEKYDFENYIKNNGKWKEGNYFVENKIDIQKTKNPYETTHSFKDTILYNRYSDKNVPFREIQFNIIIEEENYLVSIRKSLIESNELLMFITATMLVVLSFGLGLLYIFQRKISKKIWLPFYDSLTQVKSFDLKKDKDLIVTENDIHEFKELNEVLVKMTQKMRKDYRNLKEFTENASHEIQTPLALINARVEQMIQQKNYSEEQAYWIQEIYASTIRLSKLNRALLLLSKIENDQFQQTQSVNLNELVRNKIAEHEDVLGLKNIGLSYVQSGIMEMVANPDLAEILVSNLLSNAIKHNIPNGKIEVHVSRSELIVENTGLPLKHNPERLFERFKKEAHDNGSLGLGLAIVKKICDHFRLTVLYENKDDLHRIAIKREQLINKADI